MIAFVVLWMAWTIAAASAQTPGARIDLNQQAVVTSSEGTFVLSFYPDKAPRHVEHFLSQAAAGAYDGTLFHRVVQWGLVQGGDPLSRDPSKKALWGSGGMNKVKAEVSEIKHVRGTVSSVLLPNQPDSGGNQFFVCVVPQPSLDGKYSAFGFVAEGIEIIDRISTAPADASGLAAKPPVIHKVTLRPARPVPPPAFAETSPEELASYRATLDTTLGEITLEFFPRLAPNHVRNFLRLAQAGFYDGTAFHRVVPDFVLQGGILSTRQPQLPDFRLQDLVTKLKPEFNETRHVKGILSMARGDELDSADTSFFICLGDATSLDKEYTAFGRVVEGLDVVEKFPKLELEGETPRQRIELRKVTLKKAP